MTPTVVSVVESLSSGDLDAGNTITLTLNLSEAVTVTGGTLTLILNDGGTATYTGGSGTNALTFSYTVAAGQNTSDLTVTAVNLNSATVTDGAGNAANLSLTDLTQSGPQIDTTPPTVSSVVESPSSGDLDAGNTITLTLNLSEVVTVAGGTPTLTLNDGGTATYTGGSGTNALTFSYTVAAGQNTSDLTVTAVNLNSATVTDGAGNTANLSLTGLTQTGPQIDSTAPTVVSVASSFGEIYNSSGDLTTGSVVTLTLNLSEAVTVAYGTPTLTLNDGGTATYTGGSGTDALSFSYTVTPGQNTPDLMVAAVNLNGATIEDGAGNNANLSGALTPTGPISASFFGMDVEAAGVALSATTTEPWPQIPFSITRSENVWSPGDGTINEISWANLNPAPGVFNFTELDAWMSECEAHGTQMIYTLGPAPAWAGGNDPDPAALQAFMTAIVTHAAGQIQYWEGFNEFETWFTGSMANLVTLQSIIYQTAKQIDPSCTVLSPSSVSPSDPSAIISFLDAGGGQWFNVLSVHEYVAASSGPVDLMGPWIENFQQALINAGMPNTPIWTTEWGTPQASDPSAQAAWISTALILQAAVGVQRELFYAYDDDVFGVVANYATGAVTVAGVALQETEQWLLGATMPTGYQVDGTVYSAQLTKNGQNALVVWDSAGSASYSAGPYTQYVDLQGDVYAITGGVVTIGVAPILLETPAFAAPTIASFSPDNGTAGDGITNATTLTLTGTAAADSMVTVFDGTTELGTATVNVSGAWSFTTGTLANGTHSFTATDTDFTGNTSVASSPLVVTVDTVMTPTVASVVASPSSGDLDAGNTVTLTLNLSEVVTVAGGTLTLILNDGGTATYTGGSGTNALTFSYTVAAGQNTSDLTVTAVNLNSATVTDGAGNAANLSLTGLTQSGPQIDTMTPTVLSVLESPSSGDLDAGKTVTLILNLSEAVTVAGGTPTLTLNDGGTATYTGGSGTNALTFSYTVAAGQNTSDLTVTAVNLNSATVTDGAGNAANLSLTGLTQSGPQIDTTPPTVTALSESPSSGDLNAGKTVTITLDMSEVVTVNTTGGTPTLTLNDGGTATYVGGSGSNALTFSYTVLAGQNTPDLMETAVNLNGATITDGAGNAANLSLAGLPQGSPQIDTTPPTVVSLTESPASGDFGVGKSVTLTLTMSEAVTVAGGTPTLALNDGGTATYTGGSGTNALTFSYTVAAGQNTSDLTVTAVNLNSATITDGAGNAASLSLTGLTQSGPQIDTMTPTLTSVVESPASGDLDASKTVRLTLNLSEAVTVAGGTPTLTLNDGGTATYTGGSGTNALTFSYTVAAGQNTSDLTVTAVNLNSATVTDGAGNAANLSLTSLTQSGPQIDTTPPAAPIITGDTVNANNSITLSGTAEANSTVTVYDGATSLGTTTANASGAWSFTTGTLASGTQTFTATATDAAGNTSTASNAVDPIIGQPTDDWTNAVSASWTTTADWSAGVPTSSDLVVLNAAGTYTVMSTANETIAELNTVSTATLAISSGTFTITNGTGAGVQAGTISVANGATLEVTGTFDNSGTIALNSTGNATDLMIAGNATLSGNGKVTHSNNSGNAVVSNGAAATLTNVNNTISGAGTIGDSHLTLINQGTINANDSVALIINTGSNTITNSGTLEATSTGGLDIDSNVSNSTTIEALGTNAIVVIESVITNTATGVILASGTNATVELDGATISGGTLETSGSNAFIETVSGGADVLNGVTISSGSTVEINSGTTLTLGGTVTNSGTLLVNGGTLNINGAVTGGMVEIEGKGTVTSTANETVAELNTVSTATLAISSGTFTITNGTGAGVQAGTISVANGATLEVTGTFDNSGTIALNSTGNATDLMIAGNATLSGNGKVTHSNNSGNAVVSNGAAATLTNVNNTISGAGTIGDSHLTLINQGTINANDSVALIINTGSNTITNSGTLEATSTGGLDIDSNVSNSTTIEALGTNAIVVIESVITNTATGVILASGTNATVELDGATISGGTLETSGSNAFIETVSGGADVLNGVTISSGSTVEINSGTTLTLGGTVTNSGTLSVANGATLEVTGTFDNSGTIALNSTGNATDLMIAGNATLSGNGKVTHSNNSGNAIVSNGAAATLTNVNNTISGAGTIGDSHLTLINQGTINANDSVALIINTGSNTITNSGTLEATSTGGLDIDSNVSNSTTIEALGTNAIVVIESVITNTATGVILASGTNATVELDGATISGGTLETSGSNAFIETVSGGADVLNGVTISSGSTVEINSGTTLTLGGTVTNSGTLLVNGGTLNINGAVTGGMVEIEGKGTVTSTANETVAELNTVSTATLAISSGTFTITNGTGAGVQAGTISVANGATLEVTGTFDNSGTIALNSTGNATDLMIAGNATLSGNGKVTHSNNSGNAVVSNGAAATLTNVNNTISGAGTIGDSHLTLINQGTINANDSVALIINTGSNTITNSGTLEATSTGGLDIDSNVSNSTTIEALGTNAIVVIESVITNTATGVILASGTNATVELDGATISGGTLETSGSNAFIETVSGGADVLNGVTISSGSTVEINSGTTLTLGGTVTNSGTLSVANGATLEVTGTFDNSGTIALNSTGNATDLMIAGNATLSGNGKVTHSNNSGNAIVSNGAAATLTNVNNTISGAGTIGDSHLTLINQGTVNANDSVALIINTGSNTITNSGTLEATSTGGLDIDSNVSNSTTIEALGTNAKVMIESVITNAATGVILASGSGAQVDLDGATISGGTLETSGSNAFIETVSGGADVLNGVTISSSSTVEINSGTTLTLGGTVNNLGTILVNSGGSLDIDGAVTGGTTEISGTGKVVIALASSENVTFLAKSTGELVLDSTSYTGQISGFGANTTQSIDLADINFAGAKIVSYVANSKNTGGVLTITSGTNTVQLDLVGTYTLANFAIASDGNGGTLLTDPPDVEQMPGNASATIATGAVLEINTPDNGAVTFAGSTGALWLDQPSTFTGTVSGFRAQDVIDLPGIAFDAQTTLGYLPNSNQTGGTLSVTNGTQSASIALLGNYIASSFATVSDSHGGTMVVAEASQTGSQSLLSNPQHA